MTPCQRSLKFLRDQGRTVAVVEHWNPFAGIRQDLFGVIDLVAIGGGVTIGVQTTSGNNVSARVAKMKASPHYDTLRTSGWKLCVHGWRKVGARGKVKKWELREEWL